jgi:hypothetical protein
MKTMQMDTTVTANKYHDHGNYGLKILKNFLIGFVNSKSKKFQSQIPPIRGQLSGIRETGVYRVSRLPYTGIQGRQGGNGASCCIGNPYTG